MRYKSIALFLAHRFLFSKNKSYSIKAVLATCFTTITVSSLALTLILGIMQGFESETEKKLQSIHPQIIIESPIGENLNFEKIKTFLKTVPEIKACTPYSLKYGVGHNPDFGNDINLNNISVIKAIDPNNEILVSNLHSKINCNKKLNKLLSNNKVLIGKTLAKNLDLNINDEVTIFTPNHDNTNHKKVSFNTTNATVGDTFKTGIAEFDNNLIITSIDFFKKNFEDFGITEIGIKLKNKTDEKIVIQKLKSKLKLDVHTWKEPYTAIVSALKLEKHASMIIAFLIILIACMTLVSLLFMLITKHTNNIATLKILGIPQEKIYLIFINISAFITLSATIIGSTLAALTGILIKKYYIIDLPDVYYITTLPIDISIYNILTTIAATTTIAFAVSYIPLKLINKLNISQLLKSNN